MRDDVSYPCWQVTQGRVSLPDGYRDPQDTADPHILSLDYVIRIISNQVRLQDGHSVFLKKTLVQVTQVLLNATGCTPPIKVCVPHDRDTVQGARGDGKLPASRDVSVRKRIQLDHA
jgi:hypothetical protein